MATVELTRLSRLHARLLNEVLAQTRREFCELTDRILAQGDGGAAWLLSGPLSRNPFVSRFHLDCARLALMEGLLAHEKIDEIIVDTPELRAALVRFVRRHGLPVRVILRSPLRERLLGRVKPLLRLMKSVRRILAERRVSRNLPRLTSGAAPVTLVDSFLTEGSLGPKGFHDRFFTGYAEFLAPDELANFYYLPEFLGDADMSALAEKAGCSGAAFLYKAAYLGTADYLAALGAPLQALRTRLGPQMFHGFDVAPLFRAELYRTSWNYASLAGYLNYRFAFRLKAAGVKVRLLVDWFENQLVDRGLALGFREAYTETPVIGYNGSIISPLRHIYIRPTAGEKEAGLIPERLAVAGRGLIEPAGEFCPQLKIEAGPAFRFRHVWKPAPPRAPNAFPVVLAALPITPDDALDILNLLAEASEQKDMPEARLLVKPHPTVPPAELQRLFARPWPARWEWIAKDFGECLDAADAVLGNASSTCVEAMARGVPVIVVGSRFGITENPVPETLPPELWRLVYEPGELVAALRDMLFRDARLRARDLELGKRVRELCFEPVDRARVRRFFNLGG